MADTLENVPDNSLLYAVDNHNVANGDKSWFEKKIDATGELVSDVGEAATYGLVGAGVAGVMSIVNTAAAAGSFLGLETEQTKTYDVLKGLDDNLASYYQEHSEGVEIGGFLLGSIAPGMAGIKALQAAKAGVMGSNTLGSLGLMKSLTADYAQLAKAEFAMTQTPFSMLNANVIKGLAQGYGTQVMEAEAFTLAATAALYKSPTIEQQNLSDLFWNDLKMSIVFGGVAGTIVGAKSVFGINKALTDVKKELLPQSFINEIPNKENVEPILKVLTYFKNKFNLPEAMGPLKVDASMGISGEELMTLKASAREKTLLQVDNLIRGSLNEFAGGDAVIGNALFEATKNATKFEDILQSLGPFAKKAGRIGTEDTIAATDVFYLAHGAKYEKFADILKTGAHDELFTGKGGDLARGYQVVGDISQLRVTGARQVGILSAGAKEDAFLNGYDIFRNPNGNYSVNPQSKILKAVTDKPIEHKILIDLEDNAMVKFRGTPGVADLATKDAPVVVRGDVVMAGKLSPIRIGKSTEFNPLNKDLMPHEVQARTIWAQTAKITDGMRIGEYDLPLLERLLQEQRVGNVGNKSVYIVSNKVEEAPKTLFRSAAFQDRRTGQVFETGQIHDKASLPKEVQVNSKLDDGGFVDHNGKYYTRKEATLLANKGPDYIHSNDFPNITGVDSNGIPIRSRTITSATVAPSEAALQNFILTKKQELIQKAKGLPVDELSTRLNTTDSFITEGTADGMIKINKDTNIQTPRYAKVTYDPAAVESMPMMNTMNHTGALEYTRQVNAVKERVKQNFSAYSREMNDLFPEGLNANDPRWSTASQGAGAGLASFANANYGTYGSWAQYVGSLFDRMLLEKKTVSAKTLNTSFARLSIDTPGIAGNAKIAEAALINNRLLRSAEAWKFHPDGSNTLVLKKEWDAIAKGTLEATEEIKINSKDVADYFKTHIELNAGRQAHIGNMKGAAGVADNFDPDVLYPIPVSTEKLKHFVLVKPRAPVSLSDKARIIAAKDEATLKQLIAQVDQKEFIVQTRADSEAWHKAVGDYESALGFNDSVVDSALKREGKLSQHFPTIDEGYLDRAMEWHMRQEELLARSMVYHRYSQEFEELKHLGRQEMSTATSQFGFISKGLERGVKDPYNDIIKTALNISRSSEYQPWINFNQFVKDTIEKPINKLTSIWKDNPPIDEAFVKKVNAISQEMGQEPVFNSAMSMLIANGNVPSKPWLSLGIAKAQSVLSTTLLQWDTFNAINNVMGNAVLSSPEINSILKAISKGDANVAGKLADLTNVQVPGQAFSVPTTKKLIERAVQNYSKDPKITEELMARYRSINTITDLSQQARDSFNRLTIDWRTVTEREVQSSVEKAAEFGRKYSGNRRAEEFNRFIASDIMRQITDLAEQAKIMTRAESNEYIQMFVNRTQGNHLYSQRPIVFQGVVGQAISLFQTYQFNLMQQLLRHVASGDGKTAAMMMAMQGSIYGLNGLPAFNFLNTHIVGNASGNTAHTDITQGVYSMAGKELGDWVLYGAGSNALGIVDPRMKINLYSRGDINPRQLTVLPTQLADIPVVSASVRFAQNLYQAADRIDNGGGVWANVSQALEHNGLSRPLSGLATIVQGYTTTREGSL